MRIIAGKAGRMTIKVPHAVARPTTDFVRQGMFSILGDLVIDACVADFFAGSGALGLEALSRGAGSCTFVDESKHAVKTIRENLSTTRLPNGRVVNSEVLSFLKNVLFRYQLIFADPPYVKHPLDTEWVGKILDSGLLLPRLEDGGILYAEVSSKTPAPEHPDWKLVDRRQYGSSAILLYQTAGKSAV